ncbi:MAG TPA: efflux RND transporter periplasmic adaptor subunit [Nitrospirota bacterium]|nr:efflux RND transporter periplasmic adaptor subunit [Nitrospirota bacterium]
MSKKNCGLLNADSGMRVGKIILRAVSVVSLLASFAVTVSAQEHAGHQQVAPAQPEKKADQPVNAPAKEQAESPTVVLSPDKVQLIGVRTTLAEIRSVDRQVRTVGRIEPDETKLAFVNTKIGGWVKKLYVSYTGDRVEKSQPLLSIYSPELVTAQEEYLLALRAALPTHNHADQSLEEVEASGKDLLESAKRRLLLWDITPEQIVELEKTGKPQTDMVIQAPLSGIVLDKMVLEGSYITPGMNLYKIADLTDVWVMADVYEYEVPIVRVGQGARVTLPYYSGEALAARVDYIYPVLDPVSRTVKVRLTMHNPGLALKPDMFCNVEIMASSGPKLVVPTSAVLFSGPRQIVYIEKKPGVYEMRQVTLGLRGEDYVEVIKGIRKGERVVTLGNFLIDSESQLRSGGQ